MAQTNKEVILNDYLQRKEVQEYILYRVLNTNPSDLNNPNVNDGFTMLARMLFVADTEKSCGKTVDVPVKNRSWRLERREHF